MKTPEKLRYTKEHEWVRVEGKIAYIGITDHAQNELGDIVYVELPEVGREVTQGEEVSNIESVKAAAPIYAPVSGRISEVNKALDPSPELVNKAPYDTFIFAVEISDSSEIDALLNAKAYDRMVSESEDDEEDDDEE